MTTTTRTPATSAPSARRWTRCDGPRYVVGVLFVITYITSIAAKFAFYPPFLDNADYIVGDGEDTRVLWGAFSEMILIIANIGTAVALYPVLKRRFPALSLGFVTARVMESVFIAVGILGVLTLVTMRQDFSGAARRRARPSRPSATRSSPSRSGRSTSGPAFVVGVGNGLLLGYMMYRTGLVPARHGHARTRRWPADRPLRHGRHPRGHRGRLDARRPSPACRSSSGSSASAST